MVLNLSKPLILKILSTFSNWLAAITKINCWGIDTKIKQIMNFLNLIFANPAATEIIEFGIVPDKSNKINSKEFIL